MTSMFNFDNFLLMGGDNGNLYFAKMYIKKKK